MHVICFLDAPQRDGERQEELALRRQWCSAVPVLLLGDQRAKPLEQFLVLHSKTTVKEIVLSVVKDHLFAGLVTGGPRTPL